MKTKINKLIKHPLVSGSVVVTVTGLIANFFNFLYNFFMARMLSVADYGTLASLISLVMLSSLVIASFSTTIVHFAALYMAKNDLARASGLYRRATKWLFITGLLILAGFIAFNTSIAGFFNISDSPVVIITGVIIFTGFLVSVNQAYLQATLNFVFMGVCNIMGTFSKFVFGILLVFLGFGVNGAMFSLLFSSLPIFILSFVPLKFLFRGQIKPVKTSYKELLFYGAPTTLTMLGLTSFITADIMIVKHYFAPVEAGIYSGLSLVGKVIFFFSAPIGQVMFPLIIQRRSKGEKFRRLFAFSLILVMGSSILLTLVYFLFPEQIIGFFIKRDEYLSASNLLLYFAVYMAIYSALNIVVSFFLAVRETSVFLPVMIFALLQIGLFQLFHDNFLQIIAVSITASGLLLLTLMLIYFVKVNEKQI